MGLATIAKLPRHKVQTEMVMKSIMPVILSGVCGIFGLIIAGARCGSFERSAHVVHAHARVVRVRARSTRAAAAARVQ